MLHIPTIDENKSFGYIATNFISDDSYNLARLRYENMSICNASSPVVMNMCSTIPADPTLSTFTSRPPTYDVDI